MRREDNNKRIRAGKEEKMRKEVKWEEKERIKKNGIKIITREKRWRQRIQGEKKKSERGRRKIRKERSEKEKAWRKSMTENEKKGRQRRKWINE